MISTAVLLVSSKRNPFLMPPLIAVPVAKANPKIMLVLAITCPPGTNSRDHRKVWRTWTPQVPRTSGSKYHTRIFNNQIIYQRWPRNKKKLRVQSATSTNAETNQKYNSRSVAISTLKIHNNEDSKPSHNNLIWTLGINIKGWMCGVT